MKNSELWKARKFELKDGLWRGSRDKNELAINSRITSDSAVKAYQYVLEKYAKGHLLDLGCGKVPRYGVYKNLITKSTTVDWLESLQSNGYVDVVADLNFPTHLPSDEYDTLLSTSVIEHIRRHQRILCRCRCRCRPGQNLFSRKGGQVGERKLPDIIAGTKNQ